ncbi:MAG: hypothetical protein AAFX39_07925 [Pseudomonadota bacterium]
MNLIFFAKKAPRRWPGYPPIDYLRTFECVALTEIGTAYLPSVRNAIDELGIATSTLFTSKIGKKLTLSAPVALQTSLLIPRV